MHHKSTWIHLILSAIIFYDVGILFVTGMEQSALTESNLKPITCEAYVTCSGSFVTCNFNEDMSLVKDKPGIYLHAGDDPVVSCVWTNSNTRLDCIASGEYMYIEHILKPVTHFTFKVPRQASKLTAFHCTRSETENEARQYSNCKFNVTEDSANNCTQTGDDPNTGDQPEKCTITCIIGTVLSCVMAVIAVLTTIFILWKKCRCKCVCVESKAASVQPEEQRRLHVEVPLQNGRGLIPQSNDHSSLSGVGVYHISQSKSYQHSEEQNELHCQTLHQNGRGFTTPHQANETFLEDDGHMHLVTPKTRPKGRTPKRSSFMTVSMCMVTIIVVTGPVLANTVAPSSTQAPVAAGANITCGVNMDHVKEEAYVICNFPVDVHDLRMDFRLQYLRTSEDREDVIVACHWSKNGTSPRCVGYDGYTLSSSKKPTFYIPVSAAANSTFFTCYLTPERFKSIPCHISGIIEGNNGETGSVDEKLFAVAIFCIVFTCIWTVLSFLYYRRKILKLKRELMDRSSSRRNGQQT